MDKLIVQRNWSTQNVQLEYSEPEVIDLESDDDSSSSLCSSNASTEFDEMEFDTFNHKSPQRKDDTLCDQDFDTHTLPPPPTMTTQDDQEQQNLASKSPNKSTTNSICSPTKTTTTISPSSSPVHDDDDDDDVTQVPAVSDHNYNVPIDHDNTNNLQPPSPPPLEILKVVNNVKNKKLKKMVRQPQKPKRAYTKFQSHVYRGGMERTALLYTNWSVKKKFGLTSLNKPSASLTQPTPPPTVAIEQNDQPDLTQPDDPEADTIFSSSNHEVVNEKIDLISTPSSPNQLANSPPSNDIVNSTPSPNVTFTLATDMTDYSDFSLDQNELEEQSNCVHDSQSLFQSNFYDDTLDDEEVEVEDEEREIRKFPKGLNFSDAIKQALYSYIKRTIKASAGGSIRREISQPAEIIESKYEPRRIINVQSNSLPFDSKLWIRDSISKKINPFSGQTEDSMWSPGKGGGFKYTVGNGVGTAKESCHSATSEEGGQPTVSRCGRRLVKPAKMNL